MTALRDGDDSALTTLMQRWELPVKRFVLRLGVPTRDTDDIAQETFVRLYQKRTSYRARAPFKPWLLTLAGNLARNRLRWRSRHREDSIDAMDETQLESLDGAELSVVQDSVACAVRAAVNALPDNLRRAVVCVELEDLSYSEAAQIMGCSAKAVETRLYRARQMLRSACEKFF